MTRRLHLAFAALLVLLASSARAQTINEETARVAFTEGLRLRDQEHDPRRALDKLKAAHDLAVTARTSYELGKTYMMLGSLIEAERMFLEVTRLPPDPNQSAAGKDARERSSRLSLELESRIPAIVVRLSGEGAPAAAVYVDGTRVPDAARSLPWKVDPGPHQVVIKMEGQPDRTRSVTLTEGKTETVDVDVLASRAAAPDEHAVERAPAAAPPAPEQPPAPAWGPTRIAAVGVGGAGVAALVAGGVLSLAAKSSFDGARATQCGSAIGAPNDSQCTPAGVAARQSAGTEADVATVVVAAGGVAVVAGVVLWLLAPKRSAGARAAGIEVGFSPRGVVLEGAF